MEIDEILRNIIINELQVDQSRVVFYNQNWNPPKDNELYVVISTRKTSIVGSKNIYDYNTNEEVKTVSIFTNIDIDITSRNRTAIQRKEEIIMALTSNYSLQQQEINQIRIFRNEPILDLSFIEAGSALHRFKISVTISSLKEKRTAIDYYDVFRRQQEVIR